MASSLLTTYARFNLAFERARGAALCDERREISRFSRGRYCCRQRRPFPSTSRRGFDRAGQEALARLQSFDIRRRNGLGPGRRYSFADLVFRNPGTEAMKVCQDRAPPPIRQPSGTVSDHQLSGRLSRPHAARCGEIPRSRRLRAPALGFRSGSRRSRGGEGSDHVQTAAILIEPIQGPRAVSVSRRREFLEALRALCDAHGLLLILDEVQSGMGRTGKIVHEHSRAALETPPPSPRHRLTFPAWRVPHHARSG